MLENDVNKFWVGDYGEKNKVPWYPIFVMENSLKFLHDGYTDGGFLSNIFAS